MFDSLWIRNGELLALEQGNVISALPLYRPITAVHSDPQDTPHGWCLRMISDGIIRVTAVQGSDFSVEAVVR